MKMIAATPTDKVKAHLQLIEFIELQTLHENEETNQQMTSSTASIFQLL